MKLEKFESLVTDLCKIEETNNKYKLAFVNANEKTTQEEFDIVFNAGMRGASNTDFRTHPRLIKCQKLCQQSFTKKSMFLR